MSKPVEVSWFSALCDDDYEFLGVPDPMLASSWEHCRNIVLAAEKGGFDNILLPSGYALGLDTTAFASAIAALATRIKLLMAVRIGESWPPQLARHQRTAGMHSSSPIRYAKDQSLCPIPSESHLSVPDVRSASHSPDLRSDRVPQRCHARTGSGRDRNPDLQQFRPTTAPTDLTRPRV